MEALLSEDFEAETFDDPETFLDYFGAHAVKLALLDVWMPTQNGIELQEQLPQQRLVDLTFGNVSVADPPADFSRTSLTEWNTPVCEPKTWLSLISKPWSFRLGTERATCCRECACP